MQTLLLVPIVSALALTALCTAAWLAMELSRCSQRPWPAQNFGGLQPPLSSPMPILPASRAEKEAPNDTTSLPLAA